MRYFILLFLWTTLCPIHAQPQTVREKTSKSFRIRIGYGLSLFGAKKRLENHFSKFGFDDSSKFSFFGIGGTTEYPQSGNRSFIGEFSVAGRIGERQWAGLVLGFDNHVWAEGFRKFSSIDIILFESTGGHFVKLEHSAWFCSPQYDLRLKNSRFLIHGGPSFDFHALKEPGVEGAESQKSRVTKIGALVGTRLRLVSGLEIFAAFRWTPKIRFHQHIYTFEKDNVTYTSTLPESEVGFSYLRLGFSYGFEF